MAYIGYFETSGDVQTALNEEKLVNPYVAYLMDDDRIDYNSLEPEEPAEPIAQWTYIPEGSAYEFNVLNAEALEDAGKVLIATIPDAYFEGNQTDVNISVYYDGADYDFSFEDASGQASISDAIQFEDGVAEQNGISTEHTEINPDSSDSKIRVYYDGSTGFAFVSNDADNPLEMDTIDPEEPGGDDL